MVSMAPTASREVRASRLQPRRQSLPSWVAEKPSRDVGLALASEACERAREPAMRHRGRQTKGAAASTTAQGANHHQLITVLAPASGSGTSGLASWVPTTTYLLS